MTTLTDILSREHQVVLKRLDAFEKALDGLEEEGLRETLRFFEDQLPLHRRKEEEVLFPVVAELFPPGVGPVACMLHEHEEEKKHLGLLREALDRNDLQAAQTEGRWITGFLREHIAKEDNVLFPMADRMIQGDQRERIGEGFAAIGNCCSEAGV